jgi:hypothetical protein
MTGRRKVFGRARTRHPSLDGTMQSPANRRESRALLGTCHCEESGSGRTTKQTSRFDKLKVPGPSRDWIATPGSAGLAMTSRF